MKYLLTDLYQDFKCTGGECLDTCCAGWRLLVDDYTYSKYQKLDDDTREWICNKIQKNQNGKYEIIKDSKGRCPFLNKNNLCDIILRKSDEFISTVCQTYPRKIKKYNDTIFLTVSASCPEVAKLIIKRNTQLEFLFFEDEGKTEGIEEWDSYNALINGLVASVEILQNEKIQLGKRYLLVLLLVEELEIAIKGKEAYKIKTIIEKYQDKQFKNLLIENLQNALFYELDQWATISSLLEIFVQIEEFDKDRLTYSVTNEALKTLDNCTYMKWKEKYKIFNKEYEKANLSVQFIFEYFMDTLNEKSLFNGIIKMYILILCIQFFEIYLYNTKGELLEEDKIKIISELSRKMEHTEVLSKISDSLMENDKTKNLIRFLICLN